MKRKGGFAVAVVICALANFVQNAFAQNAGADNTEATSGADDDAAVDKNKYKKNFKSDSDDFVERLMEEIPYSKSLKYTWNVIDGDVDLYFEGLRADRRNKGVSYKMDSLPMIGKLEGGELRANLGEDSKLTFKSDYMPFVGHVDGFQLKFSAGTDDSNISLRYKTDISW